MRKKFVVRHHCTNVIHTNHAISVKLATFHGSSDDKVEWVELILNLEINYLRSMPLSQKKVLQATSSPAFLAKHLNEDSTDKIRSLKANIHLQCKGLLLNVGSLINRVGKVTL